MMAAMIMIGTIAHWSSNPALAGLISDFRVFDNCLCATHRVLEVDLRADRACRYYRKHNGAMSYLVEIERGGRKEMVGVGYSTFRSAFEQILQKQYPRLNYLLPPRIDSLSCCERVLRLGKVLKGLRVGFTGFACLLRAGHWRGRTGRLHSVALTTGLLVSKRSHTQWSRSSTRGPYT